MKKAETEGLIAVEELEKQDGVNHAVHVAVCTVRGWSAGKCVSLAEYRKAVKEFLTAPMGGGRIC